VIPFSCLEPGNDENVMNGLGIDIPAVSVTRWPYREYHTSADNPSMIGKENLVEALDAILKIIDTININLYPLYLSKGPVFLTRYGLWVDWHVQPKLNAAIERMLILMDGKHSVFDIAQEVHLDCRTVYDYLKRFEVHKLIRWLDKPLKTR